MRRNRYRRFNLTMFHGLTWICLIAAGVSFTLPNPDDLGDLSRLAGLSDTEYGDPTTSNRDELPYHQTAITGHIPCDIAVWGDSFSQGCGGACWQNMIENDTGLFILTGDIRKSIAPVLSDLNAYQKQQGTVPPVVVIELVERHARLLQSIKGSPRRANVHRTHYKPLVVGHPPLHIKKPTRIIGHRDFKFHSRLLIMKNRLRFTLGLESELQVRILNRKDLFSSKRSAELLTYTNDAATPRWQEDSARPVREALAQMQDAIETQYDTFVVFMVAPNKLAVYTPYLNPPEAPRPFLETFLQRDARLHIAPIVQTLIAAVSVGTPNVYRPDDSHWGPVGHRLVANALIRYLEEQELYYSYPAPPKSPQTSR